MKRFIACSLLLAMLIAMFAGCNNQSAPSTTTPDSEPVATAAPADENLAAAIAYLKNIYKNVTDVTPADYERIAVVPVGTAKYEIEWTVDVSEDKVKVVAGGDMVTIDVNDTTEEEIAYVLTATLTGTDGRTESLSWNHHVPASLGSDQGAIVDMAYALEDGQAMPNTATLTGVITGIDTPYSADYKNITVTMEIEGREDKPIMCYRLKGDGAENLMIGDTITVTGILKNYKGTIEFDAACNLDKVVKGEGVEIPTDPADIMNAAYELEVGKALPYAVTLTGRIYSINTSGLGQYNNINVSIHVDGSGKSLTCYRLKGEGIGDLNIGDVITVTGNIKNYKGTIELDSGCQLLSYENHPEPTGPKDFADVLEEAKEVANNNYLPYPTTRTGVVTSKPNYNSKYNSYTFYADIEGHSTYFYSVEFADGGVPEKGDTIWVKGHMTAYNGTPQFNYYATLKVIAKGENVEVQGPATLAEHLAEAAKLANKEYLPYTTTISGTVSMINDAYSAQYGNITFTVNVDGTSVYCYRVRGDGMDTLAVGDSVKVSGNLTAYNGAPQFDSSATVTVLSKAGESEPSEPSTKPSVDANSSFADVAAAAKALGNNNYLDFEYTVTGTVIKAYNNNDGTYNVPITTSEGQINCNKLTGDATTLAALASGDTISVKGKLGLNSKGVLSFSGCTLVSHTEDEPEATEPEASEPELTGFAAQIAAVEALEAGSYLGQTSNVTGTVTEISFYNSNYHSYSFNMTVGDVSIYCHSLNAPEGVELEVGDSVTVNGELMNYNGSAQFEYKKSTMTINKSTEPELTGFAAQIAAVEALEAGSYLGQTSNVTGTVTEISFYNSNYHSYSFNMTVGGVSIYCHSLNAPEGVDLEVGDSVTVNGELMNYNGSAQFEYKKSTMTIN